MYRLTILAALAALTASAQVPLPYPIFDQDAVHDIKITFPNADWFQVLTDNYDGVRAENPYFEASLEWSSYKFAKIGVRFKGNSSYSAARGRKKPFRIKLNEFVSGQKIEGIGSFSLSNGWNDPSFVREKLYYELANALGIKAPRSNFAALTINGEYFGLYILTEVINGDFLKNYFGNGEDKGNLYKGNIGSNLAYLGEGKEAYKRVWEKQSNEEADDWTDLIALCKLINDTPASDLRAKLEPVMDIDSVLAALALDNATVNLDSYVGMAQNFNIYRRPSDGRWVWIPWDPSLAFGALSQGQSIQGMKELPLEWVNMGGGPGGGGGAPPPGGQPPPGGPGGGGFGTVGRPLATKLWANPEYKERYRQIYTRFSQQIYHSSAVLERMNQLRDMIRPWVEKDTQKLVTQGQFDAAMTADLMLDGPGGGPGPLPGGMPPPGGPGGPQGFGGIPGLNAFVTDRAAFVRDRLAEAVPPEMYLQANTASVALSGTNDEAQTVTLSLNGSSLRANYALFTRTESGGNWLVVTQPGGGVPGTFKISATGRPQAGSHLGIIRVESPGAINSPFVIAVTLTVAP
jgi:spore coat protein CotH